MESNKTEQIEALKVLCEFNGKLISNMKALIKELSGNRFDDTDQLLKTVIDVLNWEIQIVNSTMEVLNDGEERLNKEEFNAAIMSLGEAISSKEDLLMVAQFEKIIPVFEHLGEMVEEVIR